MKKITTLILVFLSSLLLVACNDSDSDSSNSVAEVRVTHASPDAPKVNITYDGKSLISGLDFAQSSAIIPTTHGTHTVLVEGLVPSGTVTLIGPEDINALARIRFDIVAVSNVSSIESLVIKTPIAFDEEFARVTVAHLAPLVSTLDVHVTSPLEALSALTVIGSLSFKEVLDPVLVTDGVYQIRLTEPNSLTPIYDSGEITLSKGSDLLVGAI